MKPEIVGNGLSRELTAGRKILEYGDVAYAVALRLTSDPEAARKLTLNSLDEAMRSTDEWQKSERPKSLLLKTLRDSFIRSQGRRCAMTSFSLGGKALRGGLVSAT